MKSKSSVIALLALVAVGGWASVEACRLWTATQQVAASQQLEMRVAGKVQAARAKQLQLANTDPSAHGAGAGQK